MYKNFCKRLLYTSLCPDSNSEHGLWQLCIFRIWCINSLNTEHAMPHMCVIHLSISSCRVETVMNLIIPLHKIPSGNFCHFLQGSSVISYHILKISKNYSSYHAINTIQATVGKVIETDHYPTFPYSSLHIHYVAYDQMEQTAFFLPLSED